MGFRSGLGQGRDRRVAVADQPAMLDAELRREDRAHSCGRRIAGAQLAAVPVRMGEGEQHPAIAVDDDVAAMTSGAQCVSRGRSRSVADAAASASSPSTVPTYRQSSPSDERAMPMRLPCTHATPGSSTVARRWVKNIHHSPVPRWRITVGSVAPSCTGSWKIASSGASPSAPDAAGRRSAWAIAFVTPGAGRPLGSRGCGGARHPLAGSRGSRPARSWPTSRWP